jgi:hypothetical protein
VVNYRNEVTADAIAQMMHKRASVPGSNSPNTAATGGMIWLSYESVGTFDG